MTNYISGPGYILNIEGVTFEIGLPRWDFDGGLEFVVASEDLCSLETILHTSMLVYHIADRNKPFPVVAIKRETKP